MNSLLYSILLFTMGVTEWVIIAVVILLLFGGRKIPELMRGMGSGIREFNKAKDGDEKEETNEEKKSAKKDD